MSSVTAAAPQNPTPSRSLYTLCFTNQMQRYRVLRELEHRRSKSLSLPVTELDSSMSQVDLKRAEIRSQRRRFRKSKPATSAETRDAVNQAMSRFVYGCWLFTFLAGGFSLGIHITSRSFRQDSEELLGFLKENNVRGEELTGLIVQSDVQVQETYKTLESVAERMESIAIENGGRYRSCAAAYVSKTSWKVCRPRKEVNQFGWDGSSACSVDDWLV